MSASTTWGCLQCLGVSLVIDCLGVELSAFRCDPIRASSFRLSLPISWFYFLLDRISSQDGSCNPIPPQPDKPGRKRTPLIQQIQRKPKGLPSLADCGRLDHVLSFAGINGTREKRNAHWLGQVMCLIIEPGPEIT